MGGRRWAKGRVEDIAAEFTRKMDSNDRIWELVGRVDYFAAELPLICIQRNGKWSIDDGSHRAVASLLAGRKRMLAYLGVPSRSQIQLRAD